MKASYLSYYEQHSFWASCSFLWDAFRAPPRRRVSLMNRQRDYGKLAQQPELLGLHLELNKQLLAAVEGWEPYDYGEGYFYQSCPRLGISGLRDSAGRIEAMALVEELKGQPRVLEIGCNAGFLAAMLASHTARWEGFDINPFLIEIAKLAAGHLDLKQASFSVSSFEAFTSEEPFDVVLSFANHSTFDGQTKQPLQDYFARCHDLLRPGGKFLFESHPPALEGDKLEEVIGMIAERFEIRSRKTLDYGTFMDRDRTYVVATR